METEYDNEESMTKEQTSCLVSDESLSDNYGAATTYGRKPGCIHFERFLHFKSPNFVRESSQQRLLPRLSGC